MSSCYAGQEAHSKVNELTKRVDRLSEILRRRIRKLEETIEDNNLKSKHE